MKIKNNKFVYVSDKKTYDKLIQNLSFIGEMIKDNEKIYIFENKSDKFEFSNDIDMSKITYGNTLYI